MLTTLNEIATHLKWPLWALETIAVLSIIIIVISGLQTFISIEKVIVTGKSDVPKGFRTFQCQYFVVYFLIMLADWLQGTNMWTLYNVSFIAL